MTAIILAVSVPQLQVIFETVTLTVENEAGTVVGSKTLAEIRSAAAAGTEGYAVTGSGAGAVYTWTLKDLPYGKYKVTEYMFNHTDEPYILGCPCEFTLKENAIETIIKQWQEIQVD